MDAGPDGNDPMLRQRAKYQRSQKAKAIAAVIGSLSLVAVIAVVIAVLNLPQDASGEPEGKSTSESTSETADDPSEGEYLVVHEETGSCLTSGPEPGNKEREVIVLGDCDDPYPEAMSFKPEGRHVYTVEMNFTKQDWQACWTVDQPADDEGYLTAGQNCGGENQDRQRIELTMHKAGRVVMSLPDTGYCLGPFEYESKAAQPIATVDCDSHQAEQLFALADPH